MRHNTNALRGLVLAALVLAFANATNAEQVTAGTTAQGQDIVTVPRMLTYQGKLTDTAGQPVPNGSYSLTLRLYNDSTGGSAFWSEVQSVQTRGGLFNCILGASNPISSLPEDGQCFLEIQLGANPPMSPRVRIASNAYAILARKADTANYAVVSAPHDHLGEAWTTTTLDRGLQTKVLRNTANPIYAVVDSASNSGSGTTTGGLFFAGGPGSGTKEGVNAQAYGPVASGGDANAVVGYSLHRGSGSSRGGWFQSDSVGAGAGRKVGVEGYALGAASQNTDVMGVSGLAYNNGNGVAYGGNFSASSRTTGSVRLGVRGYARGLSGCDQYAMGVEGVAVNDGSGSNAGARGGSFTAMGSSPGGKFGIYATASGSGNLWAGYFDGNFTVANGSKSAAVKVGEGDWRLLYCQESPESWFEDAGEGQLSSGRAHVELEPIFLKTVTVSPEHPMKVFVQLNDDCNGVYVQRGLTGFDVIELRDGSSNARFTYRVMAKRKGYENVRLHRMEPGTNPEELRAESDKRMEAEKRFRLSER